jgi:glycosyltransferase involved in cell wall biosynthesis
MRISYAIPVCYEHEELNKLLKLLVKHKREEDEIVVQADKGNTAPEVYTVIDAFKDKIKFIEFPLEKNFAQFKNHLKSYCSGNWIVQLDADELLDESFVQYVHQVLEMNSNVEVFSIARINTVDGLTNDHIRKWGWNVDAKGWVNFPDYQMRILKNLHYIQWVNKVHEKIIGHTSHAFLPMDKEYCILHNKSIERQEAQNNLYSKI